MIVRSDVLRLRSEVRGLALQRLVSLRKLDAWKLRSLLHYGSPGISRRRIGPTCAQCGGWALGRLNVKMRQQSPKSEFRAVLWTMLPELRQQAGISQSLLLFLRRTMCLAAMPPGLRHFEPPAGLAFQYWLWAG